MGSRSITLLSSGTFDWTTYFEMAAPEMISKEVVQSNVPEESKVIERDKVDKIIGESHQEDSNIDLEYEKTRLEELEEIMEDWINFNFTEHESEEEDLFTREKMIKIQEEKQVSLEEWDTIWDMFASKKLKEEEVEKIEDSQNEIGEAKNQKEDGFNPSGGECMRRQRSASVLASRSDVHT